MNKQMISMDNMKKSTIDRKGFTLIELMVVIAIIAILAAVGIAVFTSQQKTARDGRRKADIDSIAAAFEGKFSKTTTGKYDVIVATDFAGGAIPTDPNGGGTYTYTPLLAGAWPSTTFVACATLENATGGNSSVNDGTAPNGTAGTYYCKKNQQS